MGLGLLLLGCAAADGELFGDVGAEGGLVGMTGGDAGGGPPPPPPMGDGGGPPPPPPPGCAPGERVALCGVCAPDGTPQAVQNDDRSPAVDCAGRNAYEIRAEGAVQVCVRSTYQAAPGNCADLGLCRGPGEPGACAGPTVVEVARTEVCQRIAGCNAATPPQVVLAPVDTPCEGGVCDAEGDCEVEVVEGCEAFEGLTVCATGTHEATGQVYCEVDASPPEAGNCVDVCRDAANARCLLAWQRGAAVCEQAAEAGCFDVGERLVCRCARP